MYNFIRPLLFQLDAEQAHHFTLNALNMVHRLGLSSSLSGVKHAELTSSRQVMGLNFPNAVGLAAGLDKNGQYIDALASLGFGFIEIGTVTPRPQPGNAKPRLFRLPEAEAIINRFGFNNAGVDALVNNVKNAQFRGILGINIGKNFDTPIERANEDYLFCLRKVYPHASYITVNISSPNTRNLRQLQDESALQSLLAALNEARTQLAEQYGKRVPLALKIAPDLEVDQISQIADSLQRFEMDAVIATNTTLARDAVQGLAHAEETGGLSGAPLRDKATQVIKMLSHHLENRIPIIGVGGILSGQDAQEKIQAGASLVQVYSGLIYKGPALIGEIRSSLG